MESERLPCGVKDCGVWFTSEEARTVHHTMVHDPDDVAAIVPPVVVETPTPTRTPKRSK